MFSITFPTAKRALNQAKNKWKKGFNQKISNFVSTTYKYVTVLNNLHVSLYERA